MQAGSPRRRLSRWAWNRYQLFTRAGGPVSGTARISTGSATRYDPEILEFYLADIPLIHAPAHGAYLRTILARLHEYTKDDGIRAAATRAIAISDLKDDLQERGLCLRDDDTMSEKWAPEVQQFEEHYVAPVITEDWLQSNHGTLIVHYFEAHKNFLLD